MKKDFPFSFSLYIVANNPVLVPKDAPVEFQLETVRLRNADYYKTPNFSRVNILVGENNAGKSRFMRDIILKHQINKGHIGNTHLLNILEKFCSYLEKEVVFLTVYKRETAKYPAFTSRIRTYIKYGSAIPIMEMIRNYGGILKEFYQDTRCTELPAYSLGVGIKEEVEQLVAEKGEEFRVFLEEVMKSLTYLETIKTEDINKIYIPILRTLYPPQPNIFKEHTATTYQLTSSVKNFRIFTGDNFYQEVKQLRDSIHKSERLRLDAFCKFLSDTFFKEYGEVVLIPSLENKMVVCLGNEADRKIHDLGDGVQQIILLMFQLYACEDNTFICIEEPETHLHPAFQRLFLETILTNEYIRAKNLVIFFTTHSNHLLDMALTQDNEDVAIFKFTRDKANSQTNIKKVDPKDFSLLQILGVQNSSVFLANKFIWVEGRTDVEHFRTYLKLYCEKEGKDLPKEYLDFSFMNYNGCGQLKGFMDIYDGLPDIIKNYFVVVDGDFLKEKDNDTQTKETFDELKNVMGERFYTLPAYTVENLLSPELLKAILPDIQVPQTTTDTWKDMNFDIREYKDKVLGEYIKSCLITQKGLNMPNLPERTLLTLETVEKCIEGLNKLDESYLQLIEDLESRKRTIIESAGGKPQKILTSTSVKKTIAKLLKEKATKDNISDDALEVGKKLYDFIMGIE